MTRDEAKNILLFYRPGTADTEEPEIAEALALAKQDAELANWLEQQCARQEKLRGMFRQISVPAGLKEQIISERAAHVTQTTVVWNRLVAILSAATIIVVLAGLASVWLRPLPSDNNFTHYRARMVSTALRGYSMDFESSDLTQIRAYLAQQKAPADYSLPAGLQKISATGCAVENWQGAKVTMICFHTGKPLPPGEKNDLWLFVVDRASVKNAPTDNSPKFAKVSTLVTATWTEGDKLYLLGTIGDLQTIRRYL
jgi:hypothetical protein